MRSLSCRSRLIASFALFLGLGAAKLSADPARELIVHLARPRPETSVAASAARVTARLDALGLRVVRHFGAGLPADAAAGMVPRRDLFEFDPARFLLVAAGDSAGAATARTALLANPDVEWVEPNQVRFAAVERIVPLPVTAPRDHETPPFPNDPMFVDTRQWGLMNAGAEGRMGGLAGADIHARGAWTRSVGSNRLLLAVADTGVDPAQPELQARMPDGGDRLAFGLNVSGELSPAWADSFGHGTPVAAVMAALTNDGAHFDSLGMAGVCGGDGDANLGCRIVPIKIAPGRTGLATSWDIAQAIDYSARLGARAMNLSFAGGGPSRLERLAMLHAITHGCVVVAAAGNRGGHGDGRAPQYPAAYAEDGIGVQVGGSDAWDRRAAWSSFGPGLDLLAPGLEIWSAWMTYVTPGGAVWPGYALVSGTSFAAPAATGAIGLLAAARPELADDDFQQILRTSADDVGAPGWDVETGWGRLNAAAALESVRPGIGIWHDETAATAFAGAGFDTLAVAEPGWGSLDRMAGPFLAERIEVTATVAIPDSFADSARVWPRIGGTTTVRGDFRLPYVTPWAEVIRRDARSFTLRGYVYRVPGPDSSCASCGEVWLPLPPDQARFGFTALGRVVSPATVSAPAPPTAGPEPRRALTASPNPFRGATRITGPAGARLTILDLSGRIVRRGRLDAAGGAFAWDGRDDRGRRMPPALYLLRCEDGRSVSRGKAVLVE